MKNTFAASVAMLLLMACGGGSADGVVAPPDQTIASVSVTLSAEQLTIGATASAAAEARTASGMRINGRAITWASSIPAVASISASGSITAVSIGTTAIRATIDGQTGIAVLTVIRVPVETVAVSLAANTLAPEQSTVGIAEVRDAQGGLLTDRLVFWSSSNTSVATVTNSGVVTALASGTASISATSEDRSGSALLTVARASVSTVSVQLAKNILSPQESTIASVDLRDAQGNALTNREIAWSSSDPAVASVNGSGLVTANSPGSTQISATSEGRTGSSLLTVAPPAVASISIVLGASTIEAGQVTLASAVIRDAAGNVLVGRQVSWSSSNPSVASISASGVVTANSPGTAIISALSDGRTGLAALTVVRPPVATVAVELATTNLSPQQSTAGIVSLRDSRGNPLTDRSISWTSSNPSVAVVSGTGVVTAIAPGTTLITALSEGKSGSALLTVTLSPVASVSIVLAASTLQVGQTAIATAVLRDVAGSVLSGRQVSWTSSNTAVASISTLGVITAKSTGFITISAISEGKTGSTTMTVTTVQVTSVTLSPSSISMIAGDLRVVVATVRDASGNVLSGRSPNWFTSDQSIVNGAVEGDTAIITGLRAGSATVSVEIEGRVASISVLVLAPPSNVCSLIAGASVFAYDDTYLGGFFNRYNSQSVLNEYGLYGSRYASLSTNNPYGTYGSRYSNTSARSPYASRPPAIYRNGTFIAYYTVNQSLNPRVSPEYALTCNF